MDGQPGRVGAPVLVLIGPPGAGKGTQARLLADRFGLVHLSLGGLLRAAVAEGPQSASTGGGAAPDETMIALLDARLDRPDIARGVVLDDFPRTRGQAAALDRLLAGRGMEVGAAVTLTGDDDAMIERMSGRITCASCGEAFPDAPRPTDVAATCDACGGTVAARGADDRAEATAALEAYRARSGPLIEHYARRGVLLRVDAMRPIEEVALSLGGIARALGN